MALDSNFKTIVFRRNGYFRSLMVNPEQLLQALEAYFIQLTIPDVDPEDEFLGDAAPPKKRLAATIPGLCQYLGCNRTLFMEIKSTTKHDDAWPSDSIHYLRQACLLIEDETIQSVVIGRGNPAFAKFLLNAYNDATEKSTVERVSTHNHLHISLADPDSIQAGLGDRFLLESQRLSELSTSSLINKRIDLGDAGHDARKSSPSDESGSDNAGKVFDVEWNDVDDKEIDLENFI